MQSLIYLNAGVEPNHDLDGFLYLAVAKIKRQSSGNLEFDCQFYSADLAY